MTTLPPLPAENEDPWFEKRQAFDLAVKTLLEGDSSPETIQAFFAATLKLAMFEDLGDLIVGADADGGAATILPRGTHGQVLQARNEAPLGIVWTDGLTTAQTDAQNAINIATATAIEAIRSVITEYAVNDSETVAPTTGWSTDQPTRAPGEFIWSRTITTKGPDDDIVEITSAPVLLTGNTGATGEAGVDGSDGAPGADGSDGAPGADGSDGKGLTSSVVTYQVHSNGTTAPTGSWVSSPPATLPGQFLWTRTVLTWTDASTSTAYSVAAHGANGAPGSPGTPGSDGADGIDGNDGIDGKGIVSGVVTYQAGNSGTVAPVGTWLSTPPATTTGQFLWTRTVFTYSDATSSTAYAVAAHGATGSTGSTGSTGAAGRGISSTGVSYQASASGVTVPTGTWVASPPGTTPGQFLWSRTIITYTDATTSTSYSVALHGVTGATGKGISSAAVTYQVHSNGTTAPTGTWVSSPPATTTGQFLWTRTITTYTDATTTTSYSIAAHGSTGSTGSTGSPGTPGVSVTSVTPYFLQVGTGSATPAKPTLNPPGGSWSLTEPAYTTSTELYRTELILYSNATFSYTNVSKVSSYTASTQAITAANLAEAAAQGLIEASATDPGHYPGRLWMVLDGSGNTIGMKISNGSAWSSYALMADMILVPGSVGPTQIANGAITTIKLSATAIDGMTVTGAVVRTAASGQRIQLDSAGLKSFNSSNVETGRLEASSGGLQLSGKLRSGSANQRVEMDSAGLKFFDSTGLQVAAMVPYAGTPGTLATAGVRITGGNGGELKLGPALSGSVGESWGVDASMPNLQVDLLVVDRIVREDGIKVGSGVHTTKETLGFSQLTPFDAGGYAFTDRTLIQFPVNTNRVKIYLELFDMSVAASIFMRWFDATTGLQDTTGYYSSRMYTSQGNGVQAANAASMEIAGATATEHAGDFTLVGFEHSDHLSKIYGQMMSRSAAPAAFNMTMSGFHTTAKTHNTVRIYPASGTFSGRFSLHELV